MNTQSLTGRSHSRIWVAALAVAALAVPASCPSRSPAPRRAHHHRPAHPPSAEQRSRAWLSCPARAANWRSAPSSAAWSGTRPPEWHRPRRQHLRHRLHAVRGLPCVGAGTRRHAPSWTPSSPRSPPTTAGSSGAPTSAAWTWTWPTRSPSTERQRLRRRPHRLARLPHAGRPAEQAEGPRLHRRALPRRASSRSSTRRQHRQWSTLLRGHPQRGGRLRRGRPGLPPCTSPASPTPPTCRSATPSRPRFRSPPCQGDLPCPYDAFVTKLAPDGDGSLYSTYLGGDGGDIARGIDVDEDGNAYVAGSTRSPDFPTVRAFQNTMRGEACGPPPGEPCRQAFLTKLNPSGATAEYSTYLGGREHDDAYGVAVDRQHRAHVTGATQSAGLPHPQRLPGHPRQHRLHQRAARGVLRRRLRHQVRRQRQELEYSTYLRRPGRGPGPRHRRQTERPGTGRRAHRLPRLPATANAAQADFGGYIDGFALQLRRSGTPVWSTFLGGTDADRATGIATDKQRQHAHLTGRTLSPDFPTRRPFQPTLMDQDYDAFVSIIK